MNAIFRLVEIYSGVIIIDGIDIQKVHLEKLRSSISIIPQRHFLFSGTIRSNLDPYDENDDGTIWDSFHRFHLKEYVDNLPKETRERNRKQWFQFECRTEAAPLYGKRFSQKKTKILVMDEETASVDNETDFIIQKTVREQFKDSTVLTVCPQTQHCHVKNGNFENLMRLPK
jgi:ABC-type multidrug transport system fused ATPase/permease subunit